MTGHQVQRLRIWRRKFRARLEGCGIWQRSVTEAEMRERSRSRTRRRSSITRSEADEAETECEEEEGETEQLGAVGKVQAEFYGRGERDPELWQRIHR